MGHIGALEEIKDGFLEGVPSKLRPGRLARVRRESFQQMILQRPLKLKRLLVSSWVELGPSERGRVRHEAGV